MTAARWNPSSFASRRIRFVASSTQAQTALSHYSAGAAPAGVFHADMRLEGIAGLLSDRFDFEIFPLRRRVDLDKS